MKNLKKVAKMAGLAFINALRLHRDSILLYKSGSLPSGYLLSILAQEEIGKSFLLEDYIFQNRGEKGAIDPYYMQMVIKGLLSHHVKQLAFSRQADDVFKYKGKRCPKIIREVSSGVFDKKKQAATYVGLTNKGRMIDPNGKIINPTEKIRRQDVESQITRVNDFIIDLVEGCRRGTSMVETEELDRELTLDLVGTLEGLWPAKSKDLARRIEKIRKFPVDVEV